jgi:DNA-binding transcriptional MerR regulator
MESTFSIGDLAREFDLTTRAIRFYEDQGLLFPKRRGQTRLFDQRDRTRLKLILRGKRLGFPLAEIREIVDMYDAPPGEAGQLSLLVEKVEARRARLLRQREDIAIALRELDAVEARCAERLAALEDGAAAA